MITGPRFVRGCVVHAPSLSNIELCEDAFLSIDPLTGRIAAFHTQITPSDLHVLSNARSSDVLHLRKGQFIIPGFVDTHVHAPQFQFMGTATDLPLMQWLEKYTFPVEQAFEDPKVALKWYSALLDTMLSQGITTAQYFATIHLQATKILVDLVESRGQRGLVGLVSMDRNAPDTYILSTDQCLADAEDFIQYVLNKALDLVKPVITPRFVPTCSLQLMDGLGALAKKYNVHVQSHIAESRDEEAFVETLHPGKRDIELFEKAGLLTPKSCMAHAVHLKENELEVLHRTGTAISCCPLSNFFFANGFLDVRKVLEKSVNVGLGTDIAGGYSPSMLRAIQTCVLSIKALEIQDGTSRAPTYPFDFKDAFYLATMGGAKALNVDKDTGSFAVGKCFDAIFVDVNCGHNLVKSKRDTSMDVFQKFIHNADNRNFTKVYVKGKVVYEKNEFSNKSSVSN
ncbi:guanine deaminase [Plasmopara halstedii]|uniref:Guanine deaminase n=1 Tax=Plasmopara halstedii TaxID=4781 RepID=A0A0P1AV19_PLAHL|nr:guanine deaminase [Plasmopara halstedii]CEG45831.1 guanine deaminase [Plasmopara halstedii]|eukprot:XP_024582200.1 guanine deaminase [Plasmopara halstedii]